MQALSRLTALQATAASICMDRNQGDMGPGLKTGVVSPKSSTDGVMYSTGSRVTSP